MRGIIMQYVILKKERLNNLIAGLATTKKVIAPVKKGDNFSARSNEFFLERINRTIILNVTNPITRLNIGDMTQLSTTAPSFNQLITVKPPAMIPKPIIAPTMEWVVETGSDFQVA